jgi:hypothetical protein
LQKLYIVNTHFVLNKKDEEVNEWIRKQNSHYLNKTGIMKDEKFRKLWNISSKNFGYFLDSQKNT